MLLQEPSNEYDPSAVSVNTLWGEKLGYMPKEVNQEMQLGVSYGRVLSAGQNEKGLFGAKAGALVVAFPTAVPASAAGLQTQHLLRLQS